MKKIKAFSGFILIAFALAIYGCKSSTAPVVSSYHIVPPSDTLPEGHTWDYWLEAYVKRRFSIVPFGVKPSDTIINGVRFSLGPVGSPTKSIDSTRRYSIQRGTAVLIFFNIAYRTTSGDTSLAQVAYDDSIISGGLRIPARTATGITGSIDGDPLLNLEGYYEYTKKPFDIFVADSNYWGIRVDPAHPGFYHACAGGYYIMIDQLSVGDHTIHFHVENGITFTDSRSIVTVQ